MTSHWLLWSITFRGPGCEDKCTILFDLVTSVSYELSCSTEAHGCLWHLVTSARQLDSSAACEEGHCGFIALRDAMPSLSSCPGCPALSSNPDCLRGLRDHDTFRPSRAVEHSSFSIFLCNTTKIHGMYGDGDNLASNLPPSSGGFVHQSPFNI